MSSQSQKSFIVFIEWYDAIKDLTTAEKGELFDAIFRYHLDATLPDLSPGVRIAFRFMKGAFDQNTKKYKAVCERNRINGSKPKRNKPIGAKKASGFFGKPEKLRSDSDSDSKSKFDFKKSLRELNIPEHIVLDWLTVRKSKKASNTQTAFNRIKSEIEKSGHSPTECITIAVEKSWAGFEDKYLEEKSNSIINGKQTINHGDITSSAGYDD